MKCPECEASDKRSTVVVGPTVTTLMAGYEYYDEDGKYHSHDPNTHTTQYCCSNGHRWAEDRKSLCPACVEPPGDGGQGDG